LKLRYSTRQESRSSPPAINTARIGWKRVPYSAILHLSQLSGFIVNFAILIRLIILAAIWGGSFLFIRIGAPVLGPVILIEYRIGLAAALLPLRVPGNA